MARRVRRKKITRQEILQALADTIAERGDDNLPEFVWSNRCIVAAMEIIHGGPVEVEVTP